MDAKQTFSKTKEVEAANRCSIKVPLTDATSTTLKPSVMCLQPATRNASSSAPDAKNAHARTKRTALCQTPAQMTLSCCSGVIAARARGEISTKAPGYNMYKKMPDDSTWVFSLQVEQYGQSKAKWI